MSIRSGWHYGPRSKQALVGTRWSILYPLKLRWASFFPAVVVSCLPSFGWLLNKRVRSDSAYKRRNPSSSGRSTSAIRSNAYPTDTVRLGTVRQGTFLDIDSQILRDSSFDHNHAVAVGDLEIAPNTIISKSSRTESQEDILPAVPCNRILLRRDMVSLLGDLAGVENGTNFDWQVRTEETLEDVSTHGTGVM